MSLGEENNRMMVVCDYYHAAKKECHKFIAQAMARMCKIKKKKAHLLACFLELPNKNEFIKYQIKL